MLLVGFAPAGDVLHVRHVGGGKSGLLMEFRCEASGNFEWRKRLNPDEPGKASFETRTGKVRVEDVQALIDRVRQAPDGPKANDVGSALFEWQEQGQIRSRTFLFPARPPGSDLLTAVDRLAGAAR